MMDDVGVLLLSLTHEPSSSLRERLVRHAHVPLTQLQSLHNNSRSLRIVFLSYFFRYVCLLGAFGTSFEISQLSFCENLFFSSSDVGSSSNEQDIQN